MSSSNTRPSVVVGKVIPYNVRCKAAADAMARQLANGHKLPGRHGDGTLFNYERKHEQKTTQLSDSDIDSDSDSDPLFDQNEFSCSYPLDMANLPNGAEDIVFRVGKGSSDASQEDRGVELLTSCPSQHSHGVETVHFEIIMGAGGRWLVKGVSSSKATVIWINEKPITLINGATYGLRQITRVRAGKLEWLIIFEDLDDSLYAKYLEQRESILKEVGRKSPDSRIWPLPTKTETHVAGCAVIHGLIGGSPSSKVYAGVHVETGEPLCVQALSVGVDMTWAEVNQKLLILFSFEGSRGLLQGIEACCSCGNRTDHSIMAKQGDNTTLLCDAKYDTVYIITELACATIRDVDWQARWPAVLSVSHDILHGLKTLHDANIMHRGLSPDNVLITSTDPPAAKIGGFGSSFKGASCTKPYTGLASLKAPEMDEGVYRSGVDPWAASIIMIAMLYPEISDALGDWNQPLSHDLLEKLSGIFADLSGGDSDDRKIGQVLSNLIQSNPKLRMSPAQAISILPEYDPEQEDLFNEPPTLDVEQIPGSFTKRKESPLRDLRGSTKTRKVDKGHILEDEVASSSQSQDGLTIERTDPFYEALKIARSLPLGTTLLDLDAALPVGVSLPGFLARCKEDNAVAGLVRYMDRQGYDQLSCTYEIPVDKRTAMAIDEVLDPQEPPTGPTSLHKVLQKQHERFAELIADDDPIGDYMRNLAKDATDGNLFVVSGLTKQGTINRMSQVTGVGSNPGSDAASSEEVDGSEDEDDIADEEDGKVEDTSESSGVNTQQQQPGDDAEDEGMASEDESDVSEEE